MASIVAPLRPYGAEIALQHRRSRDPVLRIRRILTVNRALIAAKEKQLVAQNRTARRAAELIPFERAAYFLARVGIDSGEIGCSV